MHAPVRPRFISPPCQDSAETGRLLLRDGSTAHIRRAGPADAPALAAFFRNLSAESRYRRFLSASPPRSDWIVELVSRSDPRSALTLVVTRVCGGESRIIATGSYVARDAGTAEVALAVADAFRAKGL
ncbi:MAG: GNAT family N-acetyltransferase, partial [Planctomycetia bacterium]|nr:GNAT family N-acetyltransferase [Planctomycetia bacterium]